DNSRDTWMNVTGFSVAAGGLFTYFDLVHGKNMPFVGGSLAGDSSETERRFNINIGYYF
ncbi:MAG: carbohydrate porin, partial [Pseudomonadota bacterium]